ncbi:MAG: hypothetical protein H6722_26980 [Sandaracinus sp.]|nr:hypothetical protein [Sandaracinus sp.]
MGGLSRRFLPSVAMGRRRALAAGGVAPFDPLEVPSAQQIALWREDYVDSGGVVAPWQNKWNPGTRDLANGTAANRPTITDPDALFDGNPSYQWDGTNDVVVVSADLVSFKPLHDGTGCVAWGAFRPTATGTQQIVFTTSTASAVNRGAALRYNGTDETLRLLVWKGASPALIDAETAPGSVSINAICRWIYVLHGNEWSLTINGTVTLSGTAIGTPSTGNTTSNFHAGRDTTATSFFTGKMAELAVSTLAASQRSSVAAYLAARYP